MTQRTLILTLDVENIIENVDNDRANQGCTWNFELEPAGFGPAHRDFRDIDRQYREWPDDTERKHAFHHS